MSYTLLVYGCAVGFVFIRVLPEVQEQIVVFECAPPQLHTITELAILPEQTHVPVASALALQLAHTPVDKNKAVHVQLVLPPPRVNETG